MNFFYYLKMRCSWYDYRKAQEHPISIRRALFGRMPRFSSYEDWEFGCPPWALKDYLTVGK